MKIAKIFILLVLVGAIFAQYKPANSLSKTLEDFVKELKAAFNDNNTRDDDANYYDEKHSEYADEAPYCRQRVPNHVRVPPVLISHLGKFCTSFHFNAVTETTQIRSPWDVLCE